MAVTKRHSSMAGGLLATLACFVLIGVPAFGQNFVELFTSQCPEQGGASWPQSLLVPQGTRTLKLHLVLNGGTDAANLREPPVFPDYVCKADEPLVYADVSFSVQVKDATGSTLFEETFAGVPSTLVVRSCSEEDEFPPTRTKVAVRSISIGELASGGGVEVTVESHYCLSSPSLPGRSSWMSGWLSANNTPLLGVFSEEDGLAEQRGELFPNPPSAALGVGTSAEPITHSGPEPNASQTIRVALGQAFGWGMARKGTNEPVECTFALDHLAFDPDHPVVDDSANYPGRGVSLFKDQVLLPFGFDQPRTRVTMVGLHLGTQYFRATPTDGKTRAAVVKVEVMPPHALGSRPHDVDDEIVEVANRRGIPPQWLKGNIEKEAQKLRAGPNADVFWDRESWRYEPLSADMDEVSRGKSPLRSVAPYRRYRMATQTDDPPPDGLAQGVSLTQTDIDYRSGLMIERAGERRPIAATDTDVTVREIMAANPRQNWNVVNAGKWKMVEAQREAGNDPITFNAQTPIATSYGLLQVMYIGAIRKLYWHDPFGPATAIVNPSLLMDTPQNLLDGEGSLHVSTVLHLHLYEFTAGGGYNSKPYLQPAYPIDKFDSFADFQETWRKGLRFYNYWMKGYADEVLKNAGNYRPSRTDEGIQ